MQLEISALKTEGQWHSATRMSENNSPIIAAFYRELRRTVRQNDSRTHLARPPMRLNIALMV